MMNILRTFEQAGWGGNFGSKRGTVSFRFVMRREFIANGRAFFKHLEQSMGDGLTNLDDEPVRVSRSM